MAVSVVQARAGISGGGTSPVDRTFLSNTVTGNTIVALVQWAHVGSAITLTSVTDSIGNTYTVVALESLAAPVYTGNIATAIAYCENATGGTTPTVHANFSGSSNLNYLNIFELSTSVFDQSNHANGVGTAVSAGSITTAVNGCVGIAGAITDDNTGAGGGWTKGAGWDTLLQNTGGGAAEEGCEYVAQATAGALTGNFTQSRSGTWAASVATFKPAVTGIAFDAASSSTYQAAVSSYNWSHTCAGANRVLLVGISIFAAGTVSGITYNGVALTLGSTKVNGLYRSELWYLIAPATGAHSIAVTLSTSLTSIGSAVSYTGVNQTTPIAEQASASGTGNPASVSVTTLTDNQWTTDLISTSDAAITVGAGQTSRANNNGALGSGAMSDKGPNTPAGAVTQTWTAIGVADTWAYIIAGLDPALDAPVYNVTLPDADTEICANDLVVSSYTAGIASRRLLVGVGV